MMNSVQVKRGEVYLIDLGDKVGSEQGGIRPVLIIQNDIGNKFSPTIIGVPLTSKYKKVLPTHVPIMASQYPVERDSIILCEQVRVLDKSRLTSGKPFFKLNQLEMKRLDKALMVSMGIAMAI